MVYNENNLNASFVDGDCEGVGMRTIKRIGYYIPTSIGDYVTLDSFSTITDVDIAIMSIDLKKTNYSTKADNFDILGQTYLGKDSYNISSSSLMQEHCEHWKKEIDCFLKRNGTLFILLPEKVDFYIQNSSEKLTLKKYFLWSNYNFIPDWGITYTTLCGTKMIPRNNLIKELYSIFENLFSYNVSLSSDSLIPLLSTKNDSRILGGFMPIYGGHVIFIPEINFNIPDFLEGDIDEGEEYDDYTDEAKKCADILIGNLIEIHNVINKNQEATPKPSWIDNFELENAKKTKEKIIVLTEKIDKDREKLECLNSLLEEQEIIKLLLYETGKPLENAVIHALKIMGYKAKNYRDKDVEFDQIIVSPEGDRFIGECEGKDNKDIDISKIRQLLDNINADFERDSVKEKAYGLLFGNPQRFLNPDDRNLDFTEKCKKSAERDRIGLILTSDLYKICKIIVETNDKEYAKKCRCAILEQLGSIIKFPKYHNSLNPSPIQEQTS
jgi:hypothetical protein